LNRWRTYIGLCMTLVLIMFVGISHVAAVKIEQPATTKHVAFVIDDFGNGMDGTEEMLELPIPLTIAIMPFLPTTKRDAELAHAKGHDVILHLPMQPVKGKKSWLGPGALTTDLSDEEITKRVNAAIDDIPYAIGINNHMGSKVTADERIMKIVLDICKQRGLLYLDSRTTPKSVIPKLSTLINLPYVENDLFLDDAYSMEHINKQMKKLNKLITVKDTCVAIGHVGPPGKKTAQAIRNSIGALQPKAQFIKVSEMVKVRSMSNLPDIR
jgi:polysaccharide deacetylase 2 family uncharacterized protein YibQ